MHSARKRLSLFLVCAAVLLAAGYAWGYANAHDRFYAPESLLDNELVSLNFNNRLLHYVNLNQSAECRRELIGRLREQMAFVSAVAPDCQDTGSRHEAEKSLGDARQVMDGRPLVAGASAVPSTQR